MNEPHRSPVFSRYLLLGVAMSAGAGCQDGDPLQPDTRAPSKAEWPAPVSTAGYAAVPAPYSGRVMTTESVPDPTPPEGCELFLHTTQEGEATHLGHFTGSGSTCGFNGQFGVTEPPINAAGGPPPYFVSDFTIEQTYTAANGDELRVFGQGILVQSLTDGSAGFMGGGTLDGGTGRFEGATGVFDIEGIRGAFAHFDGWIVFDASNRRH